MIRLFVAIELPEDVRERLAALAAGVRGARWVRPENLHLTLRFIGEVDEGRLADIYAALARIADPAFELAIDGIGHFGSKREARVLWAGAESNERLVRLHDKVESALVRAGLAPEERKFSPHVTLARLKRASTPRVRDFMAAHGLFRAGPFPVDAFQLFSSFLSKSGAIHKVEAEYRLDPAD